MNLRLINIHKDRTEKPQKPGEGFQGVRAIDGKVYLFPTIDAYVLWYQERRRIPHTDAELERETKRLRKVA